MHYSVGIISLAAEAGDLRYEKAIDKREKAITNKKSHRFRSSKPMAFFVCISRYAAKQLSFSSFSPHAIRPFAFAVRSGSVRRPIGFRSPSDQIPFAER